MCASGARALLDTVANPADVGSETLTLTLKGLNGRGFTGPSGPGCLAPAPPQHLRCDMWPQSNGGGGRGAQRPAGLSLDRKTVKRKWGALVCSPWYPKASSPFSRCLPQTPSWFLCFFLFICIILSVRVHWGTCIKSQPVPQKGLALLLRGCREVSPVGGALSRPPESRALAPGTHLPC